MKPIPASSERSVRKSKHRRRILIALSSVGEAYPSQLARMTGVNLARLRAIMHGRLPYYREDLSLVELGLAEEVRSMRGRVYRITKLGRRKARSEVKRTLRRQVEALD